MIRWHADDSDMCGAWNAELEDVRLFGGIIASADTELAIQDRLRSVKANFGANGEYPVKWNLRGLRSHFVETGQEKLYEEVLKNSCDLRREIFLALADLDITVIVSVLLAYGMKKDVILRTRERLVRYTFANGLMRVGMFCKDKRCDRTEVVLDWPTGGKRDPFDAEYASAYRTGKDTEGNEYYSGPLCNLRMSDSPHYSNTIHSGCLQVADLVVGALREALKARLGGKTVSFGLDMMSLVRDRLYGAPSDVLGRGIVVSPKNSGMDGTVKELIAAFFSSS